MIVVKCFYENGDTITTSINGTFKEAQEYFLGRIFNIGLNGKDLLSKCIDIVEIGGEANEIHP